MKRLFSLLLVLCLLSSAALAEPDLSIIREDPAQFSISDCYELVGEEVFHELVSHAIINEIINSGGWSLGMNLPNDFFYSPVLHALRYDLQAKGIDPTQVLYKKGDTSEELMNLNYKLYKLGYLDTATDTFTDDVEDAIRKIQYGALLPVDGRMSVLLAKAIEMNAIPDHEATLKYIKPLLENAQQNFESWYDYYQSNAEAFSQDPYDPAIYAEYSKNIFYLYNNAYHGAVSYFPEHIAQLNIQSMLIDPSTQEAFNIAHNLNGLLAAVCYCGQYELSSDLMNCK